MIENPSRFLNGSNFMLLDGIRWCILGYMTPNFRVVTCLTAEERVRRLLRLGKAGKADEGKPLKNPSKDYYSECVELTPGDGSKPFALRFLLHEIFDKRGRNLWVLMEFDRSEWAALKAFVDVRITEITKEGEEVQEP